METLNTWLSFSLCLSLIWGKRSSSLWICNETVPLIRIALLIMDSFKEHIYTVWKCSSCAASSVMLCFYTTHLFYCAITETLVFTFNATWLLCRTLLSIVCSLVFMLLLIIVMGMVLGLGCTRKKTITTITCMIFWPLVIFSQCCMKSYYIINGIFHGYNRSPVSPRAEIVTALTMLKDVGHLKHVWSVKKNMLHIDLKA